MQIQMQIKMQIQIQIQILFNLFGKSPHLQICLQELISKYICKYKCRYKWKYRCKCKCNYEYCSTSLANHPLCTHLTCSRRKGNLCKPISTRILFWSNAVSLTMASSKVCAMFELVAATLCLDLEGGVGCPPPLLPPGIVCLPSWQYHRAPSVNLIECAAGAKTKKVE